MRQVSREHSDVNCGRVARKEHQWHANWRATMKVNFFALLYKGFLLREPTVLTKHSLDLEHWITLASFLFLKIYFLFSSHSGRQLPSPGILLWKAFNRIRKILLAQDTTSSYVWMGKGRVRNMWVFFFFFFNQLFIQRKLNFFGQNFPPAAILILASL